jgi:hypothetical protein
MLLRKLFWLAVLAAWPAAADTLIVVGADNNYGENIWINENGTNTQVWSGGIDIKVDNYARLAYCIELLVNISVGTYNTVLDFADPTTNMERVAWLLNNDYPTTQAQGAGFQLAVWDIMTDSGDGFTSGIVRKSTSNSNPTDATVLGDAVAYETASLGKSSTVNIVVYHNTTTQNGTAVQTLMGLWPKDGGPVPETPEPGAVVMVLSGLALIGLSRLRRRRGPRVSAAPPVCPPDPCCAERHP